MKTSFRQFSTRNPFRTRPTPEFRYSSPAGVLSEATATPGEPHSNPVALRFLRRVATGTALFLMLVCFIAREITHNRELYRMGRLVAAAEAETRQWRERQRQEEANEARLAAELLHQQTLALREPRP